MKRRKNKSVVLNLKAETENFKPCELRCSVRGSRIALFVTGGGWAHLTKEQALKLAGWISCGACDELDSRKFGW